MESQKKQLIRFFSALADETRLDMLLALAEKPKTVNQLHKSVDKITLSAVSHQLKQLNNLGIVEFKKKGREKYFKLSDKFCWCILKTSMAHFKKSKCEACSRSLKEAANIK